MNSCRENASRENGLGDCKTAWIYVWGVGVDRAFACFVKRIVETEIYFGF